jgi:transposase
VWGRIYSADKFSGIAPFKGNRMRVLQIKPALSSAQLKETMRRSDKRTAERLRALFLRTQGKTAPEIAGILGRNVETVRTWIKLFNEGGLDMIRYKHYGGPRRKLRGDHEQSLAVWLKQGKRDDARYTLAELSERLYQQYGLRVSRQLLSERIARLGLGHLISRPRRSRGRRRGTSNR